jgi:hypothetical protein
VRAIVHENLNVHEAYDILLTGKKEKGEEEEQLQQQKMIKSAD